MKKIPEIKRAKGEMLPMMDMVFLLLIVFIFMIIQMRPNFGVSVELPEIAEKLTTKAEQKQKTVTVSVTTENEIYVNKETVQIENLIPEIKKITGTTENSNISVILRGDKMSSYGKMIEIFSKFREEGISNILFDVEPQMDTDKHR
ncbi:MAG: biopolymer transporter ExbD [Verrucomicrobiota bacterium]|nr:biopolymer transporter ExbD [Verrucomicrobiota bacterium]